MKVSPEDFDYSHESIVTLFDSPHFPGFVGDRCICGLTANVPHGAGWFCVCGSYRLLLMQGGRTPYEQPNLGPAMYAITEGLHASTRWQQLQAIKV